MRPPDWDDRAVSATGRRDVSNRGQRVGVLRSPADHHRLRTPSGTDPSTNRPSTVSPRRHALTVRREAMRPPTTTGGSTSRNQGLCSHSSEGTATIPAAHAVSPSQSVSRSPRNREERTLTAMASTTDIEATQTADHTALIRPSLSVIMPGEVTLLGLLPAPSITSVRPNHHHWREGVAQEFAAGGAEQYPDEPAAFAGADDHLAGALGRLHQWLSPL